MTRPRRPAGAGLLRLYPATWRARYEAEVLAVLEQARIGGRGRLDLIRGAMDARLHESTRLPAVAALLAGGLWTFAGAWAISQPTPPDWPGYTFETLPIAILGVAAGLVALVGVGASASDQVGRAARAGIVLAIAGQGAWLLALAAAVSGFGYGWETAAAQAVAVIGIVLVGAIHLRTSGGPVAAALVLGPTPMLFGWSGAWLALGLAWTLVGTILLSGSDASTGLEGRSP